MSVYVAFSGPYVPAVVALEADHGGGTMGGPLPKAEAKRQEGGGGGASCDSWWL